MLVKTRGPPRADQVLLHKHKRAKTMPLVSPQYGERDLYRGSLIVLDTVRQSQSNICRTLRLIRLPPIQFFHA